MRQVPKRTLRFSYVIYMVFLSFTTINADCSKIFNDYYLTHGQRYQYGKIQLLNLHGSFCNMGREYGYLEQHNLQAFFQGLYHLLVEKKQYPYQTLLQLANTIYLHYPQRYKNLLQGMAQTSGLSLQQHIFINAFEYILYYQKFQQPGCAGIAVWHRYTMYHTLIFGRNYDYFSGYPQFKRFLSLVIFHPKQPYNIVAMVTFLGTLNATTNMNQYGLFSELNNGYPSGRLLPGGGINDLQRPVTPINLLTLMFKAKSLSQLNDAIHHYHSSSDFIINFADSKRAESYEWTPRRLILAHLSSQLPGLLVSTNHFIDPAWHLATNKENIWFTLERRKNLINLANQYYAKNIPINRPIMQKILQRRLRNGGATDIKTVYQVIAIPKKRILWIRVMGLNKFWQKINLTPYFNH